jgi:PAT family acetyl-CoA transporter-like MFS transporter 1
MSKRASRSKNRGSVLREQSSTDSLQEKKNGNAKSTAMNSVMLEHRRKHSSYDGSLPSSQAASLMGNANFSLDDEVPKLGEDDEGASKGFFELSKKDQSNFLLLVLLYFLQGIPMGLAHGSVPFLLKHNVSYAAIGVFSLAAYPYSLKLLWSPIVDAVWSPKVGRRKSWILPIQTISGFSMIWLGKNINRMMKEAGETDSGVWTFTWWWFALVFLCATQDIAVDGKT